MKTTKPDNISAYIESFPKGTRDLLKQMRNTIKKAAPGAQEMISYQMPAYKLNGMLVWFAGYKNHIGFYPGASGISHFKKEISKYKWAKGSVQFPLDKKLPLSLVTKIVKFRVKENSGKKKGNKKEKKISSNKNNNTETKASDPNTVNAYMKKLKHPLIKETEALRKIILSAHKEVGEEIAWNAPAFFYTGKMKPFAPKEYKRFIVVFNFYKKDCIRLIFLRGARVNDKSGLLQGDYADGRRLALFHDMKEINANKKTLQNVIKRSVQLMDK